jgi:hypothetical protein
MGGKMRWKKWIYWLIPLCIVSSFIADVVTDNTAPVAWGNILMNFAGAMAIVLTGLMAIIYYKNFLDWLGGAPRYYPWFRFMGCVCLLFGLFALTLTAMNILAALNIIPDPYSP